MVYLFIYLSGFVRVDEINDCVIFDFRSVLADIGGYGRGGGIIHILQCLKSDSFARYAGTITVFGLKTYVLLDGALIRPSFMKSRKADSGT